MKMFKKALALVMAAAMLLSLVACGGGNAGYTGTGYKYITSLFCHDLHNNPPIIF